MSTSTRKRLLVTTIAMAGAALASSSSIAQASNAVYEMKVYVDFAGGRDVIAGRYEDAIKAAGRSADRRGEVGMIANTNLCVALTKTGKLADAASACTRAVTLAQRLRPSVSQFPYSRVSRQRNIATALSNRGVLRAVSGNQATAADDFREAARVSPADVPQRNLARLEASTSDSVARMEDGSPY